MHPCAIRVEGLAKRYRLGERRATYKALRDVLADAAAAPIRAVRRALGAASPSQNESETFWALHDVSFEIARGDVVGVIGRNGAGKSTLLKILSRITEPTRGFAEIHGRVGSLLEVGTGFHPELTGAENIYLNGVILGMRRREVERKFDEIVAFAGVEKFVDTPVKHYSSGMYLRLAFSVAAHLEPEIMLVDEVLAVGDSTFQRKCLDKMEEVGKQGRTVLFVSHNMPAVTRICPRTILLDAGGVAADGPSHQVVSAYLSSGIGTKAAREWPDPRKAPGNHVARLRGVRVIGQDGELTEAVDIRRPVGIEMTFDVLEPGWVLSPIYDFFNEEGLCVFGAIDHDPRWKGRPRPAGRYVTTAWIRGNLLSEGTLIVNAELLTVHPMVQHYHERHAVAFQVIDSPDGDTARGEYSGAWPGVIRPMLDWNTRFEASVEGQVLAERSADVL